MVPRFGGKVLMDKESGREMRGPVFVAWCFPVRLASILLIGSELGNGRMGEVPAGTCRALSPGQIRYGLLRSPV